MFIYKHYPPQKIVIEKNLLRTALVCSIIGIFIILSISENIEIKNLNIAEITKEKLEETVKITGEIISKTDTEDLIIMNVKDSTGEMTVITFKSDDIKLEKNQLVEIQGEVIDYKGKIEIEASRIIIL